MTAVPVTVLTGYLGTEIEPGFLDESEHEHHEAIPSVSLRARAASRRGRVRGLSGQIAKIRCAPSPRPEEFT